MERDEEDEEDMDDMEDMEDKMENEKREDKRREDEDCDGSIDEAPTTGRPMKYSHYLILSLF